MLREYYCYFCKEPLYPKGIDNVSPLVLVCSNHVVEPSHYYYTTNRVLWNVTFQHFIEIEKALYGATIFLDDAHFIYARGTMEISVSGPKMNGDYKIIYSCPIPSKSLAR